MPNKYKNTGCINIISFIYECLNSGWTDISVTGDTNNGEYVYMLLPRENRQPVSSIIPKELHG